MERKSHVASDELLDKAVIAANLRLRPPDIPRYNAMMSQ